MAVGALYEASALGLIRLAYLMLDDLQSAEDVVQEAFCGLYRRWARLENTDSAMYYVRVSVLNGCRSALRRRAVRSRRLADQPPALSAEAVVLNREDRAEVVRAVGRLPRRQREVLVLRFTPTFRMSRSRVRWASGRPPSGPPRTGPSGRSAGRWRRGHDAA